MDNETLERLNKAREPKPKKVYKGIAKKSAKKLIQEQLEKEARIGETELQKWFSLQRRKLSGWCKCGCKLASSKHDDKNFRSSCCHVFPQKLFSSVALHPSNCIERNFWEGHHTNFDFQGMDKWPKMADWENIKEIFHELSPLLTDEERATKFYHTFEKLVYELN